MSIEGVDYSHARPTRAQLAAAGAKFVVRYLLDPARNQGKALSRSEAMTLNTWGLPIVSNFEYSVGGMLRGYNQGVADALTSRAEIRRIGIPRDVVIFSCDVDVSISQIPAVLDYMRGASSVLGKANVGVYGEYDLIEAAWRAGYRHLWQTYAWSRGKWSSHATIQQYANHAMPGWDGDKNRAMVPDFGQWSMLENLEDDDVSFEDQVPLPADLKKPFTDAGSPPKPTDQAGRLLYLASLRGLEATQEVREVRAKVDALLAAAGADVSRDAEVRADLARLSAQVAAIQAGNPDEIAALLGEKLTNALLMELGERVRNDPKPPTG